MRRRFATLGYETTTMPVGPRSRRARASPARSRRHAVVNLVESLEGRGQLVHVVPALLESLGVPFTGCSSHALAATSHKVAAKKLLAACRHRDAGRVQARRAAGDGPWIVKSVFEHASLGIDDIVGRPRRWTSARVLDARRAEFGGRWFAERFVPGRELNVSRHRGA